MLSNIIFLEKKLLKSWRHLHKGPVMQISITNDLMLASGGTDSIVRLWQIDKAHCLYALHGLQGVTSILKFYEKSDNDRWLFAADDMSEIHVWNCNNGKHLFKLQGHFSTVTGLEFYNDQNFVR